MTRILHRPHPEQQPLLAACTTSSPPAASDEARLTRTVDVFARYPAPDLALSATAERALAGASTPRRPYAGIGAEVVADLRADEARQFDVAAVRTLLRTPLHTVADDPRPIGALLDRARYVMGTRDRVWREQFEEDRVRREDTVAARWIDAAIGNEMTETAQAVASSAPPVLIAGTDLTNALADLDEALDMPLPGTRWDLDLLAALPTHVVARMKGWVA